MTHPMPTRAVTPAPTPAGDADPLSRVPLGEQVRGLLPESLLGGRRQPGGRIVERRLAAELSANQAPVCEALRPLQALGVLDTEPNRGLRVREIGPAQPCEVDQLRAAPERPAAEAAVVRPAGRPARWSCTPHGTAAAAAGDGDRRLAYQDWREAGRVVDRWTVRARPRGAEQWNGQAARWPSSGMEVTAMTETETYETILVERKGRVGLITLNRPKALNALNTQLMNEVVAAATAFDRDPEIGCLVITGSEKAFAAGADIKEMQGNRFPDVYLDDWLGPWDRFGALRKPVVAAVAGFALGGGCELAMMCDVLLAADTAKFGQPEIKLGVLPGIGGSQRLTRAIGKAKAMDLCLTGRMMGAEEAERAGLVARIVPADQLLTEALATAETIAAMSTPAAVMLKESVNRAFETTLAEGVRFERRLFHSVFATADQKEGMAAFAEKRAPKFENR